MPRVYHARSRTPQPPWEGDPSPRRKVTNLSRFSITCPYHGNSQWRALRDESPEEWKDVVAFDAAIRSGNARATAEGKPLLGQAYLHRSRRPLDQAPIDRVTAHEWSGRQTDVFDAVADAELENGEPDGCSPWSCRSGTPTQTDHDLAS
ncbi:MULTISPECIES: hypothetical protein [unclassified Streptomyces]|uniref:hypothetical protein n=1 Tax=unclassified Streptomyces TaxID=2593676 RepID=UPI0018F3D63D